VLFLAGCGGSKDSTKPDPQPQLGGISGHVYVVNTTTPVSGVTVRIGGQSQSTDNTGAYSFSSITAGAQTLTADKPDFEHYEMTVTIPAGSTLSHDIILTSSLATGTLHGRVFHVTEGSLQGARITVGGITDWTDASGNYLVPNLPQGGHRITCTLDPYFSFSDSVYLFSADKSYDIRLKRVNVKTANCIRSTWVNRLDPDSNYCSYGAVFVGTYEYIGMDGEGLIAFDTDNLDLPSDATVDSVLVVLTTSSGYQSTWQCLSAYSVVGAWNECSVTYNTRPTRGERLGTATSGHPMSVFTIPIPSVAAAGGTNGLYIANFDRLCDTVRLAPRPKLRIVARY
jgi:hypothetical protein